MTRTLQKYIMQCQKKTWGAKPWEGRAFQQVVNWLLHKYANINMWMYMKVTVLHLVSIQCKYLSLWSSIEMRYYPLQPPTFITSYWSSNCIVFLTCQNSMIFLLVFGLTIRSSTSDIVLQIHHYMQIVVSQVDYLMKKSSK